MRNFVTAFALAALPLPAIAHPPGIFEATLAKKDAGFKTLAECEKAIGHPAKLQQKSHVAKTDNMRGSLFNRTAGNITRCEMVDGEPLIVVTPKGI